MKKNLLLTALIGLCSIGIAQATCTPPTTLKCKCQHPIIENGELKCNSQSYCGDKKCMPDGSCCETEKYCEVGSSKYCCADGQTCDTTNGCVEAKADIESLCANAGGTIIASTVDTKFCIGPTLILEYSVADAWCKTNGMSLATMNEMCPSWNGNTGSECPELDVIPYEMPAQSLCVWSATPADSEDNGFVVDLVGGYVSTDYRVNPGHSGSAFCR